MNIPTVKDENFRKRYLVILADRKKAKIFTIFLGDFEDQSEEIIVEDVPQKIKKEGSRPGKISRHIRNHLLKHLKNMGKEVTRFLIERKIRQVDGILIGTRKELFLDIKNNLPVRLKHKVIGQFTVKPNDSVSDITAKLIFKFKL